MTSSALAKAESVSVQSPANVVVKDVSSSTEVHSLEVTSDPVQGAKSYRFELLLKSNDTVKYKTVDISATSHVFTSVITGDYYANVYAIDKDGNESLPASSSDILLTLKHQDLANQTYKDAESLYKSHKISTEEYQDIYWCYENSIIIGQTNFDVQGTLNRGALGEMIYNLAGKLKVNTTNNPFVDISKLSKQRSNAIIWAKLNNVTTADTEYKPSKFVNNGSIAEFIYNLVGNPAVVSKAPYTDISGLSFNRQNAITFLYETGITTNTSKTYNPSAPITRGEACILLHRAYNYLEALSVSEPTITQSNEIVLGIPSVDTDIAKSITTADFDETKTYTIEDTTQQGAVTLARDIEINKAGEISTLSLNVSADATSATHYVSILENGTTKAATLSLNLKTVYTITKIDPEYGTLTGNDTAFEGETVTIAYTDKDSHAVKTWSIVTDSQTSVDQISSDLYSVTFLMPDNNVTVSAEITTPNIVTVNSSEGGKALVSADNKNFSDKTEAVPGQTVYIKTTPEKGTTYMFDYWTVTEDDSATVNPVESNATFTMPANDVTINATFKQQSFSFEVTTTDTNKTFSIPLFGSNKSGTETNWNIYWDESQKTADTESVAGHPSTGISHTYGDSTPTTHKITITPADNTVNAWFSAFGFDFPTGADEGANTQENKNMITALDSPLLWQMTRQEIDSTPDYEYTCMFCNCERLKDMNDFGLPATSVKVGKYFALQMFYNCGNLVVSESFMLTKIESSTAEGTADAPYYQMFYDACIYNDQVTNIKTITSGSKSVKSAADDSERAAAQTESAKSDSEGSSESGTDESAADASASNTSASASNASASASNASASNTPASASNASASNASASASNFSSLAVNAIYFGGASVTTNLTESTEDAITYSGAFTLAKGFSDYFTFAAEDPHWYSFVDIKIIQPANGTITANIESNDSVLPGTSIKLTYTPKTSDYGITWSVKDADGKQISSSTRVTPTAYSFELPNSAITVSANSEGLIKTVTMASSGGGSAVASAEYGQTGKTIKVPESTKVTLKANPKSNCRFDFWKVTSDESNTVENAIGKTTPATFTMPGNDVAVSAAFTTQTFKFTVNTSSTNGVFRIPTSGMNGTGGTNIWNIDWGDGNTQKDVTVTSSAESAGIAHTYSDSSKDYQIIVTPSDMSELAWMSAFGFCDGYYGANAASNKACVKKFNSSLYWEMTRTDMNTAPDYEYAYMFAGCTGLTSLQGFDLQQDLSIVGNHFAEGMFKGCISLVQIGNITFPNSITTIGNNFCASMFEGATSLTSVGDIAFPSGIATIGDSFCSYMFGGCTGIETIGNFTLATTVSTIGNDFCSYMFGGDNKTATVGTFTFPDTADAIGNAFCSNMFAGCTFTSVAQIILPQHVTTLGTGFCQSMFKDCSKITSVPVVFLTNVSSVPNEFCYYMFSGCSSLKQMPAQMNFTNTKTVGNNFCADMFAACDSLANVTAFTFPEAVNAIGDHFCESMFDNDKAISTTEKITLPVTVNTVGSNFCGGMFDCCSGMSSVTISLPETVNGKVGDYFCQSMFDHCIDLTEYNVSYLENATTVGNNFCDLMFEYTESVTDFDAYNFEFPSNLQKVGSFFCAHAFYHCTALKTVKELVFPSSITSVGYNFCDFMFSEDFALTTVGTLTLPNNLTNVPGSFCANMFVYSYNLSSVSDNNFTLPQKLTSAGDYFCASMFNYTGLTSMKLTFPSAIDTVGTNFCVCMFKETANLKNATITLPSSINTVGSYFCACMFLDSSLKSVAGSLPKTLVDTVGDNFCDSMFKNCKSLESCAVSYPENATSVGNSFCFNMFTNDYALTDLSAFALPTNLQTAGSDFCGQTFLFCTGLKHMNSVTYPTSLTSVGDGFCYKTFGGDINLTNVDTFVLPSGLTAIGNNFCYGMFMDCKNLKKLEKNCNDLKFDSQPTVVGDYFCAYMFYNCRKLRGDYNNFTLPQTITKCGSHFCDSMFMDIKSCIWRCLNLTFKHFNLPQNLTSVGDYFCANMFATSYENRNTAVLYYMPSLTLPSQITDLGYYFCYQMFKYSHIVSRTQLPVYDSAKYPYMYMYEYANFSHLGCYYVVKQWIKADKSPEVKLGTFYGVKKALDVNCYKKTNWYLLPEE